MAVPKPIGPAATPEEYEPPPDHHDAEVDDSPSVIFLTIGLGIWAYLMVYLPSMHPKIGAYRVALFYGIIITYIALPTILYYILWVLYYWTIALAIWNTSWLLNLYQEWRKSMSRVKVHPNPKPPSPTRQRQFQHTRHTGRQTRAFTEPIYENF